MLNETILCGNDSSTYHDKRCHEYQRINNTLMDENAMNINKKIVHDCV